MRRTFLCGGIMLIVLIGGIFVLLSWRQQARLQALKELFARIEVGMSAAEAEQVIGRQPDYIGRYPATANRLDKWWYIEGHRLDLQFTSDRGELVNKDLGPLYAPGPLDIFRRLIWGY
jgi:hypothetical protein